jgi:hypothetical protein
MDPDETQLKDTTPNFPAFSSAAPRIRANQWVGAASSHDSSPAVVDLGIPPLSLADCFRPLLVLVGIPAVFLGLLSLFWWLLVK